MKQGKNIFNLNILSIFYLLILFVQFIILNHIYFPSNWKDRFPEYYDAKVKYQKEGKTSTKMHPMQQQVLRKK